MFKNKLAQYNAMPYIVWGLGALFFLMEYFIRVSPSVITHTLMATFHVQAFALGGLSAFFYYAYISMQLPVGVLVDRFGPHKLLVVATLLCSMSIAIFASVDNIQMAYLTRFLMGLGASFAFVGTLKLISTWFPSQKFALLAGVTQALGMLGAVIGNAPMSYAFHTYGWREAMWIIAVLFLILSFLALVFIRDHNPRLAPRIQNQKTDTIKVWPSLKVVLSNPQTWLNCLFIGLLYAPTAAFGEQWGVCFISTAHHISTTQAAAEVGTLFIGLAIGCPTLGWLSDRLGKRLLIMRISAVACLFLMTAILYSTHNANTILPEHAYTLVLFLYGFFNSGIVPSYALASEVNPRRLTGIALGVTNMASVIIGAIFIPLIGWIMDHLWNGLRENGAPVYSLSNFEYAFILLPACFVIALIISFTLRETHCKHVRNYEYESPLLQTH
ncbi:MAG: MFS transporter [Gammaproteobacteria bacterium]|nr:MFS transporter [Gammaproteobacteria bacterium]